MQFISAREAAEKWEISQRRVAILCKENRIPGAQIVGNMWIIPVDAKKPIDGRSLRYKKVQTVSLKPFVKWAGGKGQLLVDIRKTYPAGLGIDIKKYAEPFVGGGAVLFDLLSSYNLDAVYISDINAELINTYRMIRDEGEGLIELLSEYENEYIPMEDVQRKDYYYAKRERFNELKVSGISSTNLESAAIFIFLNRTCFNGLFRVNRKGFFNVPMGAYKKPTICDTENLLNISSSLQNVEIVCGDYKKSSDFIDRNTFVYFDPSASITLISLALTASNSGIHLSVSGYL
jgi:DNA adenine methylase